MSYLYINTAFKETELALFSEDSLGFYKKWEAKNQMKELLEEMKVIDFDTIKGLVVNIGPGRFGALRIGLSFAQTLAYSKKIPLYPFKSMDYFYALKERFSLEDTTIFIQQIAINEVLINGKAERFEKLPPSKLQWVGEVKTVYMLPDSWEKTSVLEERDLDFFQILLCKLQPQVSISLEYGKEPSVSLSKKN
jgi:hypothetical protein